MSETHRQHAQELAAPWVELAALERPEPIEHRWAELESYARTVLRRAGPRYVLREPDEPDEVGDEVLRWRFLSLALPSMLWCAAAHTPPEPLPPPNQVRLLDRMVAPSGPVAHLHLHLNAVASFELVWSALAARGIPEPKLLKDSPLGSGDDARRRWRAMLVRAMLVRRMLAEAVQSGRSLDEICAVAPSGSARAARRTALEQFVGDAPLDNGFVGREGLLARMALPDAPATGLFLKPDHVWAADRLPLSGSVDGSAETHLLARAKRAVIEGQVGILFTRALTRYVRMACLLYRHLTCEAPVDGRAAGLGSFSETFHRAYPYLHALRGLLPAPPTDSVLDIEHVEARIRPHIPSMRKHVDALTSRQGGPQLRLIIHLIRTTPKTLGTRARGLSQEVDALEKALDSDPALLCWLRGFDLAGDEVGGPLWCAAHALHRLRLVGDRAAARAGVEPPGLTLHVGEDGWSTIGRLRAIDGPFVWKLLRRGDRLGHALILGREVREARAQWVQCPRWVRMLDLAWFLGQPEANNDVLSEVLRDELRLHLEASGFPVTLDLHQVWRGLGRAGGFVEALIRPKTRLPTAPDRRFVFRVLQQQSILWDLGPELSTTSSASHVDGALVEALEGIRQRLLQRAARWQLVIEANPTSNLIIGGADKPFAQPFFQRRPTSREEAGVVPVTLSADDPLQFATRLDDEYAYAFAGMVRDGVPASYAREWLQESARVSVRARFR